MTTVEITAGQGPLDGPLGHALASLLTDVVREVERQMTEGYTAQNLASFAPHELLRTLVPHGPTRTPAAVRQQWTRSAAFQLMAVMEVDRRLEEPPHD